MRACLRRLSVILLMLSGALVPSAAHAGGQRGHLDGIAVDWSGFYVGLQGGYGWSSVDIGVGSVDVNGWLGGGHVGLQRQFDRWVVGIEASYSAGNLNGRDTFNIGGDLLDVKASISDLVLVTGRLGYTWRDLLGYVRAGYASAEVGANGTFGGAPFSTSSRQHGWTAGVGIERKLTDRISFGIEYNYIDLSGDSLTLPSAPVPAIAALAVAPPKKSSVDPDGTHTVFARLSFKFGAEPERESYK